MAKLAKRKFIIRLTLVLVSIILSLIILEFIQRLISPMSIFSPLIPLRPKENKELHVNLRGVSPVATNSTNKWGMRGDEPPSDWDTYYTVITIGGSTTQCYYLDDRKTWPYLLQEKLKKKYAKVWVGNGGLDGQSTRAHIIFMKDVISKIKPNAVIFLIGANDLLLSVSEDIRLYGSDFDKTSLKYKIFASSRLLQVLQICKLIIFNKATMVKRTGHGNYEPALLREKEMPLPKDLKLILPSLSEYRENLQKIINIAKNLRVRVIFLTQPLLFEDSEYWREIEGKFYFIKRTRHALSAATYWNMLDIFNKELIKVCRANNIEYFDLASDIPHSNLYFYDPFHFNEKGAELVAKEVTGFLLKTVNLNQDSVKKAP